MAHKIDFKDWKGDVQITFYNLDLSDYHDTVKTLYNRIELLIKDSGSLLDVIQLKPIIECYHAIYKDEVGYKKLMYKYDSIIKEPKEKW